MMWHNDFTGSFPIKYFNQGNNAFMYTFGIAGNNLSGEIPNEIVPPQHPSPRSGYNNISVFDIAGNNFSGPLPMWIQKISNTKQIWFQGQSFTGPFPKTLAEQAKLRLFHIAGNNFSGPLPDVQWKDDLYEATMGGNNFTGPIPQSWSSMAEGERGVWRLYMNSNDLSGELPAWLANMPALEWLLLHNNRFTFKDILPQYNAILENLQNNVNKSGSRSGEVKFDISDQKPFGQQINRTMPLGSELILDLSEFDYEGNLYQWLKDGGPIEGATTSVLTIENISEADEGTYVLEVKNPALPELGTHPSQPIIFQIGADDGLNNGSNQNNGDDTEGEAPLEKPEPFSPVNESSDVSRTPTFEWSDVEVDYYILQINDKNHSDFQVDVTVEEPFYTVEQSFELDAEATYLWRVRGVRNDSMGEWSDFKQFTTEADTADETEFVIDAPTLLAPEDKEQIHSENLEFEWNSVDADEYVLHITRENDSGGHEEFFYSNNENITITETSYTIPYETLPNRLHSWRVVGLKDGEWGEWSEIRQFVTDSNNQVTSTGSEQPFQTGLHQNYPNPFNPTTQIRFTLADVQEVSIRVYDMAGREVQSLVSGVMQAGQHEVTFRAGDLASGIYMYRFITNTKSFTKSMTLVK
jgi:hypothetical protein